MRPPRTNFVLISAPRSGTNYLLSLTGQHPHAHCFYELFHRKPDQRTEFFGERYDDREDGGAFVDRVFGWDYGESTHAVGFKLFYEHAHEGPARTVWSRLASRQEVKVIDLVRENHFETYVSLQVAMQTGRWTRHYRRPAGEIVRCPPFEVDANKFADYVERMREMRNTALGRVPDNPKITVTYAELARWPSVVMMRVYGFLGLRRRPWALRLKNHLVKQQRVPLAEQVTNFAALRARFAGGELSSYFESG